MYGGTEEPEVWERNFRSLEVLAKMKCGSGLIHTWKSWQNKCGRWTRSFESWPSGSTESGTSDLWQSRQRWSAGAQLHILESLGRDTLRKWTYPCLEVLAEQVWKTNEIFRSLDRAEVRKVELQIFGSHGRAEQKCGSGTSHLWKSRQTWNAEVDLPIFGRPCRTSAEEERDLSKSWMSGGTEGGTSDLWQQRQSGIAEAKLQTFKSPGRAELMCRSWTSYRWQLRQDGSAKAELHILRRIGRAEVWNGFHVTSLVVRPNGSAEQNFRSLAVLSSWKCGSRTLHLWQVLILLIATANVDE